MRSLLLLVLLIPGISFSQSTKDLDEKFGYKNIKLESDADSAIEATNAKTGLVKIQTNNYIFYWVRDKSYLKFGDFYVTVLIGKHKKTGKIGCISIQPPLETKADLNMYKEWMRYFIALFGMPTKQDEIKYESVWKGEKATLTLNYSYVSSSLNCTITSNRMEEQNESEAEQKLQKDIKDF